MNTPKLWCVYPNCNGYTPTVMGIPQLWCIYLNCDVYNQLLCVYLNCDVCTPIVMSIHHCDVYTPTVMGVSQPWCVYTNCDGYISTIMGASQPWWMCPNCDECSECDGHTLTAIGEPLREFLHLCLQLPTPLLVNPTIQWLTWDFHSTVWRRSQTSQVPRWMLLPGTSTDWLLAFLLETHQACSSLSWRVFLPIYLGTSLQPLFGKVFCGLQLKVLPQPCYFRQWTSDLSPSTWYSMVVLLPPYPDLKGNIPVGLI